MLLDEEWCFACRPIQLLIICLPTVLVGFGSSRSPRSKNRRIHISETLPVMGEFWQWPRMYKVSLAYGT